MSDHLIGKIANGVVDEVVAYGAFVTLTTGERGLVHISEVANKFVKNIHEVITKEQEVQVKVIGIQKNGKLDLSIRKITEEKKVVDKFEKVNFDDKVKDFLKKSELKLNDLRRNMKQKQGIKKRKK